MSDATVNADSSVYYQAGYWNDLLQVRQYLNRRATDDPDTDWSHYLANWRGRPFAKALILNCGNGWVERDLVKNGMVKEAVGVDFIDDLLVTAREEAGKEELPLRYYQMDTNTARFPEDGYDLVVNFAAGHHIARLDRVFRRLAELLSEDGVLVSWDYVGPHRNQYSTAQWEAAWQTNQQLPEAVRQDMNYPHLPTMLATDPTEAIHSELIVATLARYFDTVHARTLGGAVGYPLLTFNTAIQSSDPADVADVVGTILDADAEYTDRDPDANTLFAYLISQPNKAALTNTAALTEWEREEDEREAAAERDGGRYYPTTFVGDMFARLYASRVVVAARTADLPAARARAQAPRAYARSRLRAGLRAAVAKLPGARPAYRWLRRRLRG